MDMNVYDNWTKQGLIRDGGDGSWVWALRYHPTKRDRRLLWNVLYGKWDLFRQECNDCGLKADEVLRWNGLDEKGLVEVDEDE